MSRDPSMRRWVTGALVVAALLVGGCGSGAVDGPDEDDAAASDPTDAGGGGAGDDDGGDGGSSGDGGGGDTDRDRYSWSLPVGDITPDDPHILYEALLDGGCDGGAAAVATDQYRNLSDEQRRLYDAAIAVCRGDVEAGRSLFAGAGHGGSRSMCFIYAAVVSVLEQQPPDTSGCPPNPGDGTTSTESEESTTSTESTSTTEGETTTGTGEGETTITAAGAGDGGG